MNIEHCDINGLVVYTPDVYNDDRGCFLEVYNSNKYGTTFVQDNVSYSRIGTVRGLHYQLGKNAQGKLVTVLTGSIYDVAVDLRIGSPTLGKYFGVILNKKNKKQLYIPQGFAHGFMALEENTCVMYKCTAPYDKLAERSIRWDDPTIGIRYPGHIGSDYILVSEKDKDAPSFLESELFVS